MAGETDGLRSSPWLFLLGALVFLGSLALFAYDLLNGNDLLRGLLANAAAAALVLALTGRETLSNPDSHIDTRGEAVRAILFFYGIYLLLVGLVVLAAAVLSDPEPRLAALYLAIGGVIVVVTFLTGGESGVTDRLSTLVGLSGLLLVVASTVLFAYDLVTGRDVLRGIAGNGVGAALFILWTAYDMPSDPDSGVETVTDALGVSLLFYGGYLLVAGIAIVLTGLLAHDRGSVGLLYLVLAAGTLVIGGLLAPLEGLSVESEESPDSVEDDPDTAETTADGES